MFDKLLAGVVIRATKLCNNVAPQVARKCCPYYLAFSLIIEFEYVAKKGMLFLHQELAMQLLMEVIHC